MIDLVLTEKDCELPGDLIEEPSPEFSEDELADLFVNGTLTEEAWQAHLAGASWEIQVQR